MNTFCRIALAVAMGAVALGPAATARADGDDDRTHYGRVGALDTTSISMILEGGTRNVITVGGDGSTDLDCAVKDANGRTVAFDLDFSRSCRLVVDAHVTTTATLVIGNWGLVPAEYVATIN